MRPTLEGRFAVPLKLLSDHRLAELAASGSEAAFEEIFRRHGAALSRYCRSILRHPQDAQDAFQTTMERAFASLADRGVAGPLRPWLFRIAHNESVSLLRRRVPVAAVEPDSLLARFDVESRVAEREQVATLIADLSLLPERQRASLLMRELCGLSHREIGAALSIPEAAVKQAIFDARDGLRDFEQGRGMLCESVQKKISDGDARRLRGRQIRSHLRTCDHCQSMYEAIRSRRRRLGVLFPPLMPFTTGFFGSGLPERSSQGSEIATAGLAGATGGATSLGMGAANVVSGLLTGKAAVVATAAVFATGAAGVAVVETGPERTVPQGTIPLAESAGQGSGLVSASGPSRAVPGEPLRVAATLSRPTSGSETKADNDDAGRHQLDGKGGLGPAVFERPADEAVERPENVGKDLGQGGKATRRDAAGPPLVDTRPRGRGADRVQQVGRGGTAAPAHAADSKSADRSGAKPVKPQLPVSQRADSGNSSRIATPPPAEASPASRSKQPSAPSETGRSGSAAAAELNRGQPSK